MVPRRIAILTLLAVIPLASCLNPVSVPILPNALAVHTAPFATISENGESAQIVCLVTRPGTPDLYVCASTRIYRVTPDGSVSLFMDVDAAVRSATNRRVNTGSRPHGGVRSVAFPPDEMDKGRFFVSVMEDRPSNPENFKYLSDVDRPIEADSVLLEFQVKGNEPVKNSYRCVFRVGLPLYDLPIKHIAFQGRKLFIAHGDSWVNSASPGGQGNTAWGKILRIVPFQEGSKSYTVPMDNPFVGKKNMLDEVWALGFRNPHTFCFDSAGDLLVGDIGEGNIEEINIVKRGGDYGWAQREGTFLHDNGLFVVGVRPLPTDDAKNKFVYPAAQYGHEGTPCQSFPGQAIASGCAVENQSPMGGKFFYTDFPKSGKLYFSMTQDLKKAVTSGPPGKLTQARTFQAKIFFDHDNNPDTPPEEYDSLGEAMRSEPGNSNQDRVDTRLGLGPNGEMYWTSKASGRIYLFTSSLKGGPGGPIGK